MYKIGRSCQFLQGVPSMSTYGLVDLLQMVSLSMNFDFEKKRNFFEKRSIWAKPAKSTTKAHGIFEFIQIPQEHHYLSYNVSSHSTIVLSAHEPSSLMIP